MPTAVTDIIVSAFRESNLVAVGAQPTTNEQAEALVRLQSIVAGAYGFEVGEQLSDWRVGTLQDYDPTWDLERWKYPEINSRILLNDPIVDQLFFPCQPSNGSRMQVIDVDGTLSTNNVVLDGNGRLIDGQKTVTLNTDGLNKIWIYDAELADWRTVTPIDGDGDMPFPIEFDDYFITKLAMRINPRYGRTLSDLSVAALTNTESKLRARYAQKQEMGVDVGVLAVTDNYGDTRFWPPYYRRNGWMN